MIALTPRQIESAKIEAGRRLAVGCRQFRSLQEMRDAYRALGYIIHDPCYAQARDMETGESYPNVSYMMREADSRVSAYHYQDARRDENFRAMQELRQSSFALVRGRIHSP
jgi:hypothetical protein